MVWLSAMFVIALQLLHNCLQHAVHNWKRCLQFHSTTTTKNLANESLWVKMNENQNVHFVWPTHNHFDVEHRFFFFERHHRFCIFSLHWNPLKSSWWFMSLTRNNWEYALTFGLSTVIYWLQRRKWNKRESYTNNMGNGKKNQIVFGKVIINIGWGKIKRHKNIRDTTYYNLLGFHIAFAFIRLHRHLLQYLYIKVTTQNNRLRLFRSSNFAFIL